LAAEAGIQIEYLRKKIRKEDRVQEILAQRGEQPGLICIFSALERCDTYRIKKGERCSENASPAERVGTARRARGCQRYYADR